MSCRNVEIKAKVKDLPSFLLKCEEVSQSVGEVIKQEDFFFNAKEGRLKLRKFEGGTAELIFYDRPNMEGPKLSEYKKCSVSDGSKLQAVLSRALGVSGEVKKFRHLFLVGQTRIHVDQVENLGSFMELEVVLSKNQTPEDGKRIADNLMNELGIFKEDLVSTAYVDLLKTKT